MGSCDAVIKTVAFFKIMNFLLKYNMFTEYAQTRRIQINELQSEHTHVVPLSSRHS